jgi:hypothetical protein
VQKSLSPHRSKHSTPRPESVPARRSDSGTRRQWRKGALYGGLAGAVWGAVVGYRMEVCDGSFFEQLFEGAGVTCKSGDLGFTVAMGFSMGSGLGVFGAGIGWLIEREAWVNITLPPSGRARLAPIFGYSTRNGRPKMVFRIRIGSSGVNPGIARALRRSAIPKSSSAAESPAWDTWRR